MTYDPPHPAEQGHLAPEGFDGFKPVENKGVKPPHSLDAEREVLSAVLVDASVIEALTKGLVRDDFYGQGHQFIFGALLDMYAQAVPIDVVTLAQALKDRGQFEQAGGARSIGELINRAGTVKNIDAYIAIVREKASRRRVLEAGEALIAAAHSTYDGALEAALERMDRAKQARAELLAPAQSWKWATEHNIDSLDEDAPRPIVVSSGIDALDEHLPAGGFEGGNLIVVIAPPKVGKTTYALGNVARRACEAGKRVLYCALSDAGVVRLNRKLLCGVAKVPERALKRRDITPSQYGELVKASDDIANWPLHIERIKSAKGIVERAKSLQRAHGDLVLVVVDYLQRTSNGKREMWQDIGESTGVLQDGAVDIGIPFLVLSQPTTTARREGKAIKASDTKGGGTAEEDGDLVMLLHKGQRDAKKAGLSILAGRDVEPRIWHAEDGVVSGNSVYACGWRWDYSSMRLEAP